MNYKTMTDEEIIKLNAIRKVPCIKESGECYIVKAVRMYMEGDVCELRSVSDANVFATVGEAKEDAARRTYRVDDECSCEKYMYTVEHRFVNID